MATTNPVGVEASVARTGIGQVHINTLVLSTVRIRLFDPFQECMPNAPYRLTLAGRVVQGVADADGWFEFRALTVPPLGLMEWGKVNADEEPFKPPATTDSGSTGDEPKPDGQAGDSETKPDATAPNTAKPQPGAYLYAQDIHLELHAEDEAEAATKRLHNLGFNMRKTLDENIRAFQQTYDRSLTGQVSDIKSDLWCWHDDCEPLAVTTPEMKDQVT